MSQYIDEREAGHTMTVVEGEIEVCDTCENSLGYPVAWELAHRG